MEDETLPSNFEQFEPSEEQDVSSNLKELESIYSLSQTKGWEQVKNHIEGLIQSIIFLSKSKTEQESLESYGAKRLTADEVENQLKSVLTFVEAQASEYKELTKK